MYYKQEQNCASPSRQLVGLAGVAGRWRVRPLLHHLVPLLTDGVQPLVLEEGGGDEEGIAEDISYFR